MVGCPPASGRQAVRLRATFPRVAGRWAPQTNALLAARVNKIQTAAIPVIFWTKAVEKRDARKLERTFFRRKIIERALYGKKVFSRGKEWSGKFQAVLLVLPISSLLLFHLGVIFLFCTHFVVSDSLKPISLFCCAKHQGCIASWLSSWSSYHNVEIQAFSLSLA